MKKLTELLKEFKSQAYFNGDMKIGKVYPNPYARSFVNEEGDEVERSSELELNEKRAFLEAVKSYRQYGESIYRQHADLKEVYGTIRDLVEVAQRMTIDETQDWFDGVTVSRHMKRMNESFKVFEKTLREVNTLQQRLEATYDEIGEVLSKYYEINEKLDPVGQEDGDIDNDGDEDKTDDYLLNRRKAVAKAIANESVNEKYDGPMTIKVPAGEELKIGSIIRAEDERGKSILAKVIKHSGKGKRGTNHYIVEPIEDAAKTWKRLYGESVNESLLVENLISLINSEIKRVEKGGGNEVNLEDYGLVDLAMHIETYSKGFPTIYSNKTYKLFQQLVKSMGDDEIKNNQVDESVNESTKLMDILKEALKPQDKKVIQAFYNQKPLEGKLLNTDGKTLVKMGMGGQGIANWSMDGSEIIITAKSDVRSTDAILRYMKKYIPSGMWSSKTPISNWI